jgi:hypothetical protein
MLAIGELAGYDKGDLRPIRADLRIGDALDCEDVIQAEWVRHVISPVRARQS